MCEPTTMMIAATALSAGTALIGYQAQSQQAKYQNELAIQQAESARQSMIDQTNQLNTREFQERERSHQEMITNQRQAQQELSRAIVSAGEAGASGLSLAALERDILQQELNNADVISRNLQFRRQQSTYDRRGVQSQAASRVNDAASRMRAGPSTLGTALQIGGSTLGHGHTYLGWGQ